MAPQSREQLKEQVRAVLLALTEPERKLLSAVLKLEAENLYLERPRVKEDIITEVRKVIV
jgi:hypothetical protein